MEPLYDARFTRRDMLKLTAGGAGLLALGGSGLAVMRGFASGGGNIYLEAFPTSPLILEPFRADNPLPVPAAERPVPPAEWTRWPSPPGPDKRQDSLGAPPDPHAFDAYVAKYGWGAGARQRVSGPGGAEGTTLCATTP